MNSDNQKIKLVKLWQILRNNSDENHPISTNELLELLRADDVHIERKTLYSDINLLNRCGFEVITLKDKSNMYYTEDRNFELPVLKILLDAIYSANFITEKKTAELVKNLSVYAGKYRAEQLVNKAIKYDVKYTNEAIFYNVDAIINAILKKKKISFQYFDYDIRKKRVLRKEGREYISTPIQLIFTNDNYYLITFSDKHNDFVKYRIDRMLNVFMLDEDASENPKIDKFNYNDYKVRIFSMFSGKTSKVTLLVHNSLIDVILDKFGMKTAILIYDKEHFTVHVEVDISPTFFAWCFTFKEDLKILSPNNVIEEMKDYISDLVKIYD